MEKGVTKKFQKVFRKIGSKWKHVKNNTLNGIILGWLMANIFLTFDFKHLLFYFGHESFFYICSITAV